MTKCDLHAHSDGSDEILKAAFTRRCEVKECYSPRNKIYSIQRTEKKKGGRGMDLVTITDHIRRIDSARESLALAREHPEDCFPGGEYKMRGSKEGHMLEVLCYDFNESQHARLFQLATEEGLVPFVEYAMEQRLPYILAHPAWPVVLKPKLSPEVVIEWINMFDVVETINGDLERANDIAKMLVEAKGHKTINVNGVIYTLGTTGGSDAHILSGLGRAYTVAPNARNKNEFLEALRAGEVYAEGKYSNLDLLNSQIMEGVEAYVEFESRQREKAGFLEYIANNPAKYAYIKLIPFLRPILPIAIAMNLKTQLEEESISLERKCPAAQVEMEYRGERIELWRRINSRKQEMERNMKPPGYYLPPLNGIKATLIEWIRKKWDLAKVD